MTDSRTNYGQQIDNLIRGAYSVKTQSYSLPVTASKSTPCFCCPVFSGGERQSFLLETVRGYDIIRIDRKITFEQL